MAASRTMDKPDVNPPITEQDDLVEIPYGVEVADPYRWLEDFTSDRACNLGATAKRLYGLVYPTNQTQKSNQK